MSTRRWALALMFGASLLAASQPVVSRADTITYGNLTNFSGSGYANGGATNQAGNTITTLVADDITPGAGLGGLTVNAFSFTMANFNAASVSVRPRVRFYQSDGAGSGPGTLIAAFSFNPITIGASSVTIINAGTVAGAGYFTMPNTLFWAGITFDDNVGTTGITAAQLNNIGQGIFNPPTVGSSVDAFFQTTAAGSFVSNNPAGGFFFFGGTPVANFGWQFVTTAVPEPSPLLLGTGLMVLGGLVRAGRARLRARAA